MASKSNQSSVIIPLLANNLGAIDSNMFTITEHKLNGHNYLQWSQSVMMFICRKGNDDYLTGTMSKPGKEDPKFQIWKFENNMVMSWLNNSMTNEISDKFFVI